MVKLITIDNGANNKDGPYRPLKNGETASLLTIDEVEKTADFTALANYSYSVNSTAGVIKVKLPSTAENGATITLQDTGSVAAVKNITIRNATDTATLGVLDVNSGVITLSYNTIIGKWSVIYKTPTDTAAQFVICENTAPQTVSTNTQLIFPTAVAQAGDLISVNLATGDFTLLPGYTYKIRVGVTIATSNGSGAADFQHMIRNKTAGTFIGNKAWAIATAFATNDGVYMGTAEATITPSVTTVIASNCINAFNVNTINAPASPAWIEIRVISTPPAVNTLTYNGKVVSPLANGTALGNSSANPLTIATVTLPVAGTYQITGYFPYLTSSAAKVVAGLSTGGSIIANTNASGIYVGSGSIEAYFSNSWQITTTTDNTLVSFVQWTNSGSSGGTLLNNAANGYPSLTYELISTPTSIGSSSFVTKSSNIVNSNVEVALGNLKARIPTTGNKSLQIATASGTYSVYGSCTYASDGGAGAARIDSSSPISVTTNFAYLNPNNNFPRSGDCCTWLIMDKTSRLSWRLSFIIGDVPGYTNNTITIEQLL